MAPRNSRLRGDPNTPLGSIGRTMLRGFIQEHMKVEDVFATCLTCRKFDAPNYYCKKWKDKVPPAIIVQACGYYDDKDDIPF